MTSQTKKIWSKPELIVLVRGKPEESVLSAGKINGQVGPAQQIVAACGRFSSPCIDIAAS